MKDEGVRVNVNAANHSVSELAPLVGRARRRLGRLDVRAAIAGAIAVLRGIAAAVLRRHASRPLAEVQPDDSPPTGAEIASATSWPISAARHR
jgi:hypothetical protein